ncbi:MAG: hypothetical protein ACE5JX_22255, partial [Acidobacteriota bacterium]
PGAWEPMETPDGLRLRMSLFKGGKLVGTYQRTREGMVAYPQEFDDRWKKIRDFIWSITEFQFLRREKLEGRQSLLYSFRTPKRVPKSGDRTLDQGFRRVPKRRGRMWFDGVDGELVRVEGEYYGTVVLATRFVFGGVEIKKGTRWSWQMTRTPSGDWVPLYSEVVTPGRAWLFIKRYTQELTRYRDYASVEKEGAKR